jgi:hypothetical protein
MYVCMYVFMCMRVCSLGRTYFTTINQNPQLSVENIIQNLIEMWLAVSDTNVAETDKRIHFVNRRHKKICISVWSISYRGAEYLVLKCQSQLQIT